MATKVAAFIAPPFIHTFPHLSSIQFSCLSTLQSYRSYLPARFSYSSIRPFAPASCPPCPCHYTPSSYTPQNYTGSSRQVVRDYRVGADLGQAACPVSARRRRGRERLHSHFFWLGTGVAGYGQYQLQQATASLGSEAVPWGVVLRRCEPLGKCAPSTVPG
jgi:hypothetical protein